MANRRGAALSSVSGARQPIRAQHSVAVGPPRDAPPSRRTSLTDWMQDDPSPGLPARRGEAAAGGPAGEESEVCAGGMCLLNGRSLAFVVLSERPRVQDDA